MSSEKAPDRLALIQEFVNSVELPDGVDELGSAETAASWLCAHDAVTASLSPGDVQRLVDTREALRDLLEAHTRDTVRAAAVVRLQALLGQASLVPVLSVTGASLASSQHRGVDGFLGAVSAAIVEASIKGTWARLKVCRQDSCRWAFYDRSKNGCACWCSMRVCGSREKARAYRARRKSRPAGGNVSDA